MLCARQGRGVVSNTRGVHGARLHSQPLSLDELAERVALYPPGTSFTFGTYILDDRWDADADGDFRRAERRLRRAGMSLRRQ
jgi:hypothetical protein